MKILGSQYLQYYVSTIPILGLLFLIYYIFCRINKTSIDNTVIIKNYAVSIGFSYLGLTFGLFTGLSSSPIASTVTSAFLTFLGGLITYLYIKEKDDDTHNSIVSIIGLITIPLFLMYGTEVGIKDRIIYEKNAKVEEMIKEKTEIELRHSSENGFPQFPMDSLPKE